MRLLTLAFSAPPTPEEERLLRRLLAPGVSPRQPESLYAWALLGLALEGNLPAAAREPSGKPYFPDAPGLCFSLSHTRGAVLAALSDRPVGADLELVRPAPPRLARRFGLEGEYFFRSWVRREARGKRTGAGITAQLQAETAMEPGERFSYVETFPGYAAGVSAMEEIPERAERCSLAALLQAAEQR
ncbi:4'-phosphopantetheinyl transferase family protein [Dysosmobacter sp.]|uniref:4'-phosphopantetheinyl transferase family protein n=1 Tax=Dysosmobacter sp. TaxID=2591382 RepID=UPI002A8DD4CB|nr:4'-phosphopantetheinyl transferase [Dysosmobacter sp.]MDY3281366.1 4'-phosphopantetheinyl transferase [Dysosmobacter sp.]